MPISTKNAGMSTTKAHIFLSCLNVMRRVLSRAAVFSQNRDFEGLDRSMSEAFALPPPAVSLVGSCLCGLAVPSNSRVDHVCGGKMNRSEGGRSRSTDKRWCWWEKRIRGRGRSLR